MTCFFISSLVHILEKLSDILIALYEISLRCSNFASFYNSLKQTLVHKLHGGLETLTVFISELLLCRYELLKYHGSIDL